MPSSSKTDRFRHNLAKIADVSAPLSMPSLFFLSDLGEEERAALEGSWSGLDLSRRRRIIKALAELSEDSIEFDFTTVFLMALKDGDDQVRAEAIEGLWENDSCVVLAQLLDRLRHDQSAAVRAAAANALSHFSYRAEVGKLSDRWVSRLKSELMAHLNDSAEPLDVRRRCLESVAFFSNDAGVKDSIERAYHFDENKMRASALHAMGRQMDTAWVPVLIHEMDSPDPEIRYEAARACGEIGSPACVPQLSRLVKDSDLEVRLAAVTSLGQVGGAESASVLRQCAKSKDTTMRDAAEEALEDLTYNSDPLDFTKHDTG